MRVFRATDRFWNSNRWLSLINVEEMIEIKTEKNLRSVQRLSFCYLCGKEFRQGDKVTRDHIIPKAVFLTQDRTKPLILPTHEKCNQEQSITDEITGQLISTLNKKYPARKNIRLKLSIQNESNVRHPVLVLEGIDLRGVIARWIKGFHATLYHEYLPHNTKHWFEPPVSVGQRKGNSVVFNKIGPYIPLIVETIKKNRKAGRLDRIECFNSKCVYECTWERLDDGRWACFFALKIYDWENLGDLLNFPKKGCVGWYMPPTSKPESAVEGVTRFLEIPCRNTEPLNPFE